MAHWKLDETTGSTATDASGNGHHGSLVNGPARTAGTTAGWMTELAPTTWYHLAGTYDGARVWVYVNGVLQNAGAQAVRAADADADGLCDTDESVWGTDPEDPDTGFLRLRREARAVVGARQWFAAALVHCGPAVREPARPFPSDESASSHAAEGSRPRECSVQHGFPRHISPDRRI